MCHPKCTPSAEEMKNPYKFDQENLRTIGHFRDLAADKRIILK
jgi:hypothetical protein